MPTFSYDKWHHVAMYANRMASLQILPVKTGMLSHRLSTHTPTWIELEPDLTGVRLS